MSQQPALFPDLYNPGPVLPCAHGEDFFGPTPCCEAEAERVETAYEAAQPAPARRTRPARPRPDWRIERDPDGLPVALVLHAPAPVTPYAQHQADGASAHPLSVFEAIKED